MLLLAACGKSSQAITKNPATYVLLTAGDVDTFDPAWANDTTSFHALFQIYEPLIYFKGSSLSKFEPRLASEVPSRANGLVSEDRRTYIFPIRRGVRFHDGTRLSPKDVRYSLMRFCLLDREGGPSQTMLEVLTGFPSVRVGGRPSDEVFRRLGEALTVQGDRVIVRLRQPFAPFLALIANRGLIVSKAWTKIHGGWDGSSATWKRHSAPEKTTTPFFSRANGTGPFKLERWHRSEGRVHLVRNDGYWRAPAKLERAVLRAVPEFSTRKLMLLAGDADAIYADRDQLSKLYGLPGIEVIGGLHRVVVNPVVHFNFDIASQGNPFIGSGRLDGRGIPPDFFRDPDIRKAFAHAFDYEGYVREVLGGKDDRARGPIPKGLFGYDAARGPPYDYDLKKAATHFRKAFGGKLWDTGFRMTVVHNLGNTSRRTIARMLERGVENLNPRFDIDVRGLEWAAYLDRMSRRQLPIFLSGAAAEYPDPHYFAFHFLHSRGTYASQQGFADSGLDRLVERAGAEPDGNARTSLYAVILGRARDLVPQLYIVDADAARVQRAWVRGSIHQPMFPGAPHGCYLYPVHKEPPGVERPNRG